MKKIAIVYWSGTGNTAQMAEAVAEGAGAAGAQANLFAPSDFSPAQVKDYDAIAQSSWRTLNLSRCFCNARRN